MTEGGASKLKIERHYESIGIVDVSHWSVPHQKWWKISQSNKSLYDWESLCKRSDRFRDSIQNRHTDHLRTILDSGWDVNEILYKNTQNGWTMGTALCEASHLGWAVGVKLLFDAGANYKVAGVQHTPLYLAVQNPACPVDVIELLLKHGADPNDHDGEHIPLLKALSIMVSDSPIVSTVHVLLENGADPNVFLQPCPLISTLGKALDCLLTMRMPHQFNITGSECTTNVTLFKTLLIFGADVNCADPLLHRMLGSVRRSVWTTGPDPPLLTAPNYIFLQEHLDTYFQFGGNIHKAYKNAGTGLEFAVQEGCHSNSIRWLIRHGADTSTLRFSLLRRPFVQNLFHAVETPLILLQAGMRVPQGTFQHLVNMEDEVSKRSFLNHKISALWDKLGKAERFQRTVNARAFPEYLTKQMVDLQKFSDKSLQFYPEVTAGDLNQCIKGRKQFDLDQIRVVLEFLSQPQSLQWYCRRCVRENLVSLQPSVVTMLRLPSKMKRYILCHDI